MTPTRLLARSAAAVALLAGAAGCHTDRGPSPAAAARPPHPLVPTSAPAVADASYLAGVRQLLTASWPHNRTVTVVCHGHSVPAGYFRTPDVHMLDAYPNLLHARLCAAYPHAVVNVIVTAIGGENSESGAARFDRDVLAVHPDVVTIDYALNDRGIGLPRAKAAWSAMIRAARAAGAKVVLLTPTPDTTAHLGDLDDALNQHAEQVRQIAAEYHVALVDSLAVFEEHMRAGGHLADLMAQSNHPNRRGHELVAAELARWFVPE